MKKEYAYRDKSGCYVAFEYDGHVFALAWRNKVKNGEGCFTFCPISSDTEFTVQFATAEEATAAIKKVWLKLIYTQEWAILENKNFNMLFECVDKLKWKEWNEYQEVQRHKAPLAAIAVGNRVYKDTYSTALSDGNAWVFAAGVERLFNYPVQATHKIDQLLIAVSQYPDMKLFDTEEERTEWSLKYLEEYAAKPEPTPELPPGSVVEVSSHTHVVTPMRALTAAPPNSFTELPLPHAPEPGVDESWDVVDNNGMPHGVDAAMKFTLLVTASPDSLVTASPDSQPLTADSSIKTMKPGVTPQPSRSRIGKIAARPYEYVYDGPQQMGTTFVSRYRIDDEVWVRVADKLVKMKVIDIYVSCKKWEVEYSYRLGNDTLTIHNRPAENQLYDTLFDLISAMTSISVEELIAAAKEVV